jgi:glucose-1-phosphate thymidylyltransferase
VAAMGLYVACLEEIAWRKGFVDDDGLRVVGEELAMTEYGKYLI